jgi:hypothetical protein
MLGIKIFLFVTFLLAIYFVCVKVILPLFLKAWIANVYNFFKHDKTIKEVNEDLINKRK